MTRESIESLVGVPSKVSLKRLTTESTVEELNRIYADTKELQSDMRVAYEDLRLEARTKIVTRRCIDFNVIHSSMDWVAKNSASGFWSSLFIQLGGGQFTFLPGTLFETLKHLKKRSRSFEKLYRSSLSRAFMSLESASIDTKAEINADFVGVFSRFKEANINEADLYMLSLLQNNLSDIKDHRFPEIDFDFFAKAVGILSVGSRADLCINNSVDAYNYALVHKLNRDWKETNTRYVIVSNAFSMLKLHTLLERDEGLVEDALSTGVVRTAKSVAIQQLIMKSSKGNINKAMEEIASMLYNIASFREILQENLERSSDKNPHHDGVIGVKDDVANLISSFDMVQQEIDLKKHNGKKHLSFFNVDYNSKNPQKFFKTMEKTINRVLDGKGVLHFFERQELGNEQLLYVKSGKSEKFSYNNEFEIKHKDGEVIASARAYSDHCVFFGTANLNLNEFLIILNKLKVSLFTNFSKESYNCNEDFDIDKLYIGDGENVSCIEVESNSSYVLENILSEIDLPQGKIEFLRIDNELFSISHEGDIIAFSTKYEIADEISVFLNEMAVMKRKSKKMPELVAALINEFQTPLIDLSIKKSTSFGRQA